MNGSFSGPEVAHVVIDMQRLFGEDTVWHTPDLAAILPNVERLARAFAGRNHFARFVVPPNPEAAAGSWQTYYRRWPMVTGEALDPALIGIIPPLGALVEPERVIDKYTYSIFKTEGVRDRFAVLGLRTLIFTGVETDVCVLAGLLEAVDLGFHSVVVTDAVASGSRAGHDAILTHVLPRLPDQIRLMTTDEVLAQL